MITKFRNDRTHGTLFSGILVESKKGMRETLPSFLIPLSLLNSCLSSFSAQHNRMRA
nr:MAG TPA: hypothetical protein [Caudoviricetes sp.]